jgi:predicted nucleotidyltransferase component of viral defense system
VKPLRARIQAACASTGAPQTVVEKDYAISYVLLAIARTMTLRTAFVLKGGTTLKKLYFGDYRFSEDLDVSAVDAPTGPGLEAALREVATDTAGLLAAHGPFDVSLERYTEHSPHPAGQEAFIVRVRFPWHPSPLCRVKLEVTHDEPVLLPPEERPILHAFEETIEGTIRCYRLEEVVAEKLRALLQTQQRLHARGWTRPRARDYYDLWRVLTRYGEGLERSILPELIAAKCRHRGVSYGSLDSFFSDDLVAEAQRHWQASLGSFVTPLPSCDLVLDELRPLLDGLV